MEMYYSGSDGCLLVYDVTNMKSFEKVEFWMEKVRAKEKKCKFVLLGNKCDEVVKRQVNKG